MRKLRLLGTITNHKGCRSLSLDAAKEAFFKDKERKECTRGCVENHRREFNGDWLVRRKKVHFIHCSTCWIRSLRALLYSSIIAVL